MVGSGRTFRGMILTLCGFWWQPMLLERGPTLWELANDGVLPNVRYGISIRVCDPQLICVRESGLAQGFDFNQGNLTGKKGLEGCG
jgi:hypothetical protein